MYLQKKNKASPDFLSLRRKQGENKTGVCAELRGDCAGPL